MTAIAATIGKLTVSDPVTAIVTALRVYAGEAPQNAVKPYLVVSQHGRADEELLGGNGRYPRSEIEVECVAASASDAMDLGETVIAALRDGVKETIGSVSDVDVTKAGFDQTDEADVRQSIVRRIRFFVRWRRS